MAVGQDSSPTFWSSPQGF